MIKEVKPVQRVMKEEHCLTLSDPPRDLNQREGARGVQKVR